MGRRACSGAAFVVLGLLVFAFPFVTPFPVTYSFGFENFTESNTDGILSTVNTARITDGVMRLTQNASSSSQASAVWYTANKVMVDGFTTKFTLFMRNNTGANTTGFPDGIAFVIQNQGPSAAAQATPGCLGYGSTGTDSSGIKASIAIEFDTYRNTELEDPVSIDHISVHSLGTAANNASEADALAPGAITDIPPLRGVLRTFTVVYADSYLAITVDNNQGSSLNVSYDLVKQLGLKDNDANGTVWIGFTASCIGQCLDQEIHSWSFEYAGTNSAKNSKAAGPGLHEAIAGEEASFIIQAVDQFGYNMTTGGMVWNVTIEHEVSGQIIIPTITDFANGTYNAAYNATEAGTYSINVALSGEAISGGPWTMVLSPTSAIPQASNASGDGLHGPIVAGSVHLIQITAKDRFGNIATTSNNATFILELAAGPNVTNITAESKGDGLYEVSYNLTKATEYVLSITLDGTEIAGSPFSPVLVTPAPASASEITAEGEGTKGGNIEDTSSFNLTIADAYGNIITSQLTANETLQATIELITNNTQSQATPNAWIDEKSLGNGVFIYIVSYNATTSGWYRLTVTLNGENIKDSPFTVSLAPGNTTVGKYSFVYGPGATSGVAGVQEQFVIQTRDTGDNNMTIFTNQTFAIAFSSSGGSPARFQHRIAQSQTPGVYDVYYNTTESGQYTVNITIDSQPVANQTWVLSIQPNVLFAPFSRAEGDGLDQASKNKVSSFSVLTYDWWQNPVIIGGANISAQIQDRSEKIYLTAAVTDLKNGQYNVSYQLTDSGHYMLQVSVNNQNIIGSPFFIEISPEKFDTKIFIWIGIGVGGGILILVLLVAALLYYRYRKNNQYSTLRGL